MPCQGYPQRIRHRAWEIQEKQTNRFTLRSTLAYDFEQRLFRPQKDEDGAALIEYTVLLGILLIAVITVINSVGGWISGKWTALNSAL